ncbi:tRNA-splicing endonuclease subunit sen54 [Diatrype stigma]|uniref:tRNA-splicing endonuclease subunit sen54 n=1 Tax=Diatrype stigma TaxID=117547 RepID=A0AAN9UT68_9PEZI
MPFDDDDDPTLTAASAQPDALGALPEDVEDALEDEAQQDFRLFAQSLAGNSKTKTSGRTLRRGEKDFESHGTRAQEGALEASREAMHDVLGYTRTHKPSGYLRGWYFPDRWAHMPPEDADEEDEEDVDDGNNENGGDTAAKKKEKKDKKASPGMFTRDRVVVLDLEASLPLFKSMGRVVAGLEKGAPAWGKTWLLPEEALHLVERGSLDLWWPMRGLEEIFPPQTEGANKSREDSDAVPGGANGKVAPDGEPDYDIGLPLSLQAAYSLFIGNEGERGKISLEKYQVYSNLRRTGYTVLRATPTPLSPPDSASSLTARPTTLWQWLFSLFSRPSPNFSNSISATTPPPPSPKNPPPYGPLVKPGLYRSYNPLFAQLAIIPRHEPKPNTQSYGPAQEPFRIYYHVWKSAPGFTKSRPPPPDFRIAVVDARESSVPTLQQLTALVESTPWDPPTPVSSAPPRNRVKDNGSSSDAAAAAAGTKKPSPGPQQSSYNPNMNIGLTYKRLKHGWRNAIVAVNDRGLISYLRFGEMAFAHERLYERFDGLGRGGGGGGGKGKRGGRGGRGRGGGRGGGGRGGRGRG